MVSFLLVALVGDLYGLVMVSVRILASQGIHMDGEDWNLSPWQMLLT